MLRTCVRARSIARCVRWQTPRSSAGANGMGGVLPWYSGHRQQQWRAFSNGRKPGETAEAEGIDESTTPEAEVIEEVTAQKGDAAEGSAGKDLPQGLSFEEFMQHMEKHGAMPSAGGTDQWQAKAPSPPPEGLDVQKLMEMMQKGGNPHEWLAAATGQGETERPKGWRAIVDSKSLLILTLALGLGTLAFGMAGRRQTIQDLKNELVWMRQELENAQEGFPRSSSDVSADEMSERVEGAMQKHNISEDVRRSILNAIRGVSDDAKGPAAPNEVRFR